MISPDVPSASDPPGSLAVVVVDYHGWPDTRECLDSLGRCSGVEMRIVVVNTGHPDSGVLIQREHPGIELIQANGNVGFGEANNLAIRALESGKSPPRYVFLLNNDTRIDRDTPARLVQFLEAHPDIDAVGPKILFDHRRDMLWAAGGDTILYRAMAYNRGTGTVDDGRYDRVEEVSFLSACAFCARREAFAKGGLFDPDFFLYMEDAELCVRWKRSGLQLRYLPDCMVYHKGSRSCGSPYEPLQSRLRYRNRLLLAEKTLPVHLWLSFLLFFLPLIALRDLLRFARLRQVRSYLQGVKGMLEYFTGRRGRPANVPEHPDPPDYAAKSL